MTEKMCAPKENYALSIGHPSGLSNYHLFLSLNYFVTESVSSVDGHANSILLGRDSTIPSNGKPVFPVFVQSFNILDLQMCLFFAFSLTSYNISLLPSQINEKKKS